LLSDDKIWRYLGFAKKASEFSDYPQHQLGCVLIYGKSVLGIGCNTLASHPKQKQYNQYRQLWGSVIRHRAHSEIRAIESAKHFDVDWRKVTVYVYRQFKNGEPALARPCAACMSMIKSKGIRRIVYSDSNTNGYTIEQVI
jgi:deoxycytidylate deaminase